MFVSERRAADLLTQIRWCDGIAKMVLVAVPVKHTDESERSGRADARLSLTVE